jgi:hypothetical protein
VERFKLTVPPKDPARRKDFYDLKWTRASDKLTEIMECKENAIDALFAECDQNVQNTRVALDFANMHMRTFEPYEWEAIVHRARLREDSECPICMGTFAGDKAQVVLSCSHVFHESCIHSYERFTAMQANEGGMVRGCPMCRSAYQKAPFASLDSAHEHEHYERDVAVFSDEEEYDEDLDPYSQYSEPRVLPTAFGLD